MTLYVYMRDRKRRMRDVYRLLGDLLPPEEVWSRKRRMRRMPSNSVIMKLTDVYD